MKYLVQHHSRLNSYSIETLFGGIIQRWHTQDVKNWLAGISDVVSSYSEHFNFSDGNDLLSFGECDIEDLGIDNASVRQTILAALTRLQYLSFDAESDNLQNGVAQVGVQARNFYNELKRIAGYCKNYSPVDQPIFPSVLVASSRCFKFDNLLKMPSRLTESTKKLLHFLDRPPFLDDEKYQRIRKSITTITYDIVDSSLNEILYSTDTRKAITNLQMSCAQLYTLCDKLIEENEDTLMIQNCYFCRCEIRRRSFGEDLGLEFETYAGGIHVVMNMKFQTCADLCRKLDIGDEIVEINDQVVVGWPHDKTKVLLQDDLCLKVSLLLKKQPRDSWNAYKSAAGGAAIQKHNITTSHNASTLPHKKNRVVAAKTAVADAESSPSATSRRRSSTFGASSSNIEQEAAKVRRSLGKGRKWKSTKATTCPLKFHAAIAQEKASNNQRRASVSGGSPTLQRLSLHVNRKRSLIPKGNMLHAIDGLDGEMDKCPVAWDRDKFMLFANIPGRNSSSNNSAENPANLDQSGLESEDDVFSIDNASVDQDDVELLARESVELIDSDFATVTRSDKEDPVETLDEWTAVRRQSDDLKSLSTIKSESAWPADAIENRSDLMTSPMRDSSEIDQSNDDNLRGVVDFEGATTLPSSLSLTSKISRRKIEEFFGENFGGSFAKAYQHDAVSVASSAESCCNRSAGASSPPKKRWPTPKTPQCVRKFWTLNTSSKKFLDSKVAPDAISATGSITSLKQGRSPRRAPLSDVVWKSSGQSLNSAADDLDFYSNNDAKLTGLLKSLDESDSSDEVAYSSGASSTKYDPQFHAAWVNRYRMPGDPAGSKWVKRWATLCNGVLRLYASPADVFEPEGLICLRGCKVSPHGTHYRSSRKNIFEVQCSSVSFYFYCLEKSESLEWLKKLGLSAIGYGLDEDYYSVRDTGYFFHALDKSIRRSDL